MEAEREQLGAGVSSLATASAELISENPATLPVLAISDAIRRRQKGYIRFHLNLSPISACVSSSRSSRFVRFGSAENSLKTKKKTLFQSGF
ncbi:hypothetical protein L6164_013767 [Bauhinia variegata]|uniref:Uncharacterized protein n=1 Tax=Bauhinia variegata TaxID=167791 RepID=A0ACB9NGM9_BAUVA|nr:hypothetical protein L6164_013767 [Bauhinia variegata]